MKNAEVLVANVSIMGLFFHQLSLQLVSLLYFVVLYLV